MDMHSSSLEVKEVQERDSGSYKIFAINSEGSSESTASLLVAYAEGQNAKYLEFLRKSERTREHIERLVQKRRDDRLKVDLRCIGSPFDKRQEAETVLLTLSPTKGMVRTISFENIPSLRKEFDYDQTAVRNKRSVRGKSDGEALLDEEIKLKLQRLREAKKAMLEKKKVCVSQGSPEVQLTSVRTVGFRDNKSLPIHPACAAAPLARKGPVFQTIEQISEKSTCSAISATEKMTSRNSNRGLEKKSDELQMRMERILGLPERSQALQELANRSTEEKIFHAKKATVFQGAKKKHVSAQAAEIKRDSRLMDYTYAQGKSAEMRMDAKTQKHSEEFKIAKVTKKTPSPLVYVLLTDDVSEERKPEMVMSDTISFNVNEPTAVLEKEERSQTIEMAASVKEYSLETKEGLLAEVPAFKMETTEIRVEKSTPKHTEPCPPLFLHEVESQVVDEGESCVFDCGFQGDPHITAIWYNNDKPLQPNQDCTINTTENYSSLTFSSVVRDLEGSVTCVIFNQYGTATTSGILKVKVKEISEAEPINICKIELLPDYAEEEEELSLAFDSAKDAEAILNTSGRSTLLLPQANLPKPCILEPDLLSLPVEIKVTAPTPTPEQDEEFKEVIPPVELPPEEHPGEQTSPGVKHKFKFSFDVVHVPPKIIKEMEQYIRCKEGDSVVLECIISAQPLTTITWLQNDGALIPTEKYCFEEKDDIYRLHIDKLSTSDAGMYKCVAENKAGIVETVCTLSVDPTVETCYSNVEHTDLKTVQSQTEGVQEKMAKEHLDNYFESSMCPVETNFSNNEYSVSQQFHSVSTTEIIGETCTKSREMESQLPTYLNDIMKSLLADESESTGFQIQDKKEISNEIESKVEDQKITVASGILSDANKLRDISVQQGQVKMESTFTCTATEITSNNQSEMVVESHKKGDTVVTTENTTVNHDVDFGMKNVKDETTKFEKTQTVFEEHGFTELISITSQSESSIHFGKEISVEPEVQEFTQVHLEPELENVQDIMEMPSSDFITQLKKEVLQSSISDREDILVQEEKTSSFDEEAEKEKYCGEELVQEVDVPEFVLDLKHILPVGDNLDKNIQEQSEAQQSIHQYQIADALDISLDEKTASSNIDYVKDQNSLQSEKVHIKEQYFVTKIMEADTNKTAETVPLTTAFPGPDLYSSQSVSNENELIKEANGHQENILCQEKKELDIQASLDTGTDIGQPVEIVVKDPSDLEGKDISTDKITENVEIDTSELCYNRDICKDSESTEEIIFELKQLSLSIENIDRIAKDLCSDSEDKEPDTDKTLDVSEETTSFQEQEMVSNQEFSKDNEPVKTKYSIEESILSLKEESFQNHSNLNVDNVIQEDVSHQPEQIHVKEPSIHSVLEIIDEKCVSDKYSIVEGLKTDITENKQKSVSVFEDTVYSEQEFSPVIDTVMEESNANQPSLLQENGIFDLKQAYSDVENKSQPGDTVQPEEIYFKNLVSTSEDIQVNVQNIAENAQINADQIIHPSQDDSFILETEKESVQEYASPENEKINSKLAFLNIENVDQQPAEKLLQEEKYLKFLYSGSEKLEAFQGQKLTSTQEISNDSDVVSKTTGDKEGTFPQEKALQTQEQTFDLKAHVASISEKCLLKEVETVQKEGYSFNLKSAFEMMSKETESFIKQLQNRSASEEGLSLSEVLRQHYKMQLEGENSPEQKPQTEAELSVAQILKRALESLSTEQEAVAKGPHRYEGKFSEDEVLRMPDEAFIWGQREFTPLSQYFQNLVEQTEMSKHSNLPESIVQEVDSFISDLKKAAQEKRSQCVHKVEEEITHTDQDTFIKEMRSSSSEGSSTERLFNTPVMPEEQHSSLQGSSDTPDKEPSFVQFLLSLKNALPTSENEEKTEDIGSLTEQEHSSQYQLEKERQCEITELVQTSLGNLSEENIGETTLQTHEESGLPQGETDSSLAKYLLAAGEQEIPDVRDISFRTLTREGSITSLEVEDVTFSTVYDYYNQQQELTRPFSPESEMSIDIDNASGDEMMESEGFYTPPSSVEHFESPTSSDSYHTPVGSPERYATPVGTPERYSTPVGSPERYSTPSEEPNRNSDMARPITPPECYRTPIGSPLLQRKSSPEELRAEMFGTPCEALEPKGNEMPPAFIKALTKRKIYENSTLRFIAEVIGFPIPDVKWYRNKSLLEQDQNVKIQKEGDICILEIRNVQRTGGGEYMCHAVNIIGEAKSITQVEVLPHDGRALALPPPVTHQHVIEFDIEEGSASRTPSPQEILLEVELDENEIKECEKQLKIVTIPEDTSDNRSTIVSLDVLPLSLVEHAMASSGKESEDIKIDFQVTEMPPRFITPVFDTEVPKASDALFHCTVSGFPTPVVQWFKGNKCIASDVSKYIVTNENGSHSLKIQNVWESDSGMYLCKAVNTVGEATCKCSLVVTECQRSFAVASEGSEAGLDSNRPQKIDLLVDNTIQNGSQTEIELEFEFERETDESQKAVKLVAVTEQEQEEEGESCVNINFDVFAEPSKEEHIEFKAESTDSCSFEFQVTEAPPKFMQYISDCASFIGTSACFQCLVVGSPKPVISWFKNGTLILGDRYCMEECQVGCHSLLIKNLVKSDEGEYKCVATNKAGTACTTALLTIC